jgi:hypothetical protein
MTNVHASRPSAVSALQGFQNSIKGQWDLSPVGHGSRPNCRVACMPRCHHLLCNKQEDNPSQMHSIYLALNITEAAPAHGFRRT